MMNKGFQFWELQLILVTDEVMDYDDLILNVY
jgi:hypothetical protein